IIASRGSELALWQANFVQEELKRIGVVAEIRIYKTQGDAIQDLSFDKLEGKGFFTKEIEEALLKKEADLAVHSHKDLPTESPAGLSVAAVSYRENPKEMILVRREAVDVRKKFRFRQGAVVGTSSARRKSQLLAFRPDIVLKDLRGNVPTRVQKLRDGHYDAILVAAAGIERLGLDLREFHVEEPDVHEFVPAPAQGVLALQTRSDDNELIALLKKLDHEEVKACIRVERKILNLFDGGCQLPLGVHCTKEEDLFKIHAAYAEAWDKPLRILYTETAKPETAPERMVEKLRSVKPGKVYITRDLRDDDFFFNVLRANGCEVNGKALIDFRRIEVKKVPDADWVFFSSKHAVRNFLSQVKLKPGTKIAAVGKATSDELRKYNLRADFIGGGNDTRVTAKQFGAVAGRSRVLFPQAKGSLKTVQQLLPAAQITDLVVYETLQRSAENIPAADVLVFTSPSNVEAFFEKNSVSTQKLVAMGHATGNTLKEKGFHSFWSPDSFDDTGLVRAVMAALAEKK
ncbi:MAG TPA: hydroxymethylbilane synthase, partial [Bacteroidia bacterium]|nr:hydroxymethylbilane synthase [Bacteroidia bacterium]